MVLSTDRRTAAPAQGRELSLGQEALWFLQELNPDCNAYNVTAAMVAHFPLDEAALAAAVERTIARHGILHAVFRAEDGEIRRHPCTAAFTLAVHDLGGMDEQEVRRFAQDEAQRPFRLDRTPPFRAALLRRDRGGDILLVAVHHIAADNISQMLIVREILDEYTAGAGPAAPRNVGGGDFDDFVGREREYLASPRALAARTYWRAELERAPAALDLAAGRPRPAVHRFEGSEVGFALAPQTVAGVKQAAAARNVTVFAYLFTVFQVLLYQLSRQNGFIVGYPVTQRSSRRYRDAVGHFVNTIPMHVEIDPQEGFDAALRRTKEKLWNSLLHREYPFALMPRLLSGKRDPSRPGLISAMFVMNTDKADDPFFEAIIQGRRIAYRGVEVSGFDVPQQQGQFDLTLQMTQYDSTVHATLKYNTALYSRETAADMAAGYLRLLESAAGGTLPARLGDIPQDRTPSGQGEGK
jgi:Condensation domain